jgi:hypothetical protein
MNQNEELTGTHVLIHPWLINDEAGKAGKIGQISSASVESNDFLVRFADGSQGNYKADAILKLKSSDEILQYLEDNATKLSTEDYKSLQNIAFLEEAGLTVIALPNALKYTDLYPVTLISIEDHLTENNQTEQKTVTLNVQQMKENELLGTLALVHPDLTNDPANKTGHVGKIVLADIDQNDFHVRFDDEKVGLYAADALLVLQKPDKIYNYLDQHSPKLIWSEYKDLFNIALIQKHGYPSQLPTAFEIAMKNPTYLSKGMITLEAALDLKIAQSRGR